MRRQLLADGGRAARVRLQAGDVGRRRGRRLAEQVRQHEIAARHGRSSGAVGGDLENARLRQQTAAHAACRQRRFAHLLAAHAGYSVVLGQAAVEEGEVRVEQVAHAEIFREQLLQEQLGFRHHRLPQTLVVLGIQPRIRGGGVYFAQPKRLAGEVLDETLAFRVRQHAFHFRRQHARRREAAGRGLGEQRRVRHAAPEEIRKARGEGVFVQLAAAGERRVEQKRRRGENGPQRHPQHIAEGFAGGQRRPCHGGVGFGFAGGQRAAKRPRGEVGDRCQHVGLARAPKIRRQIAEDVVFVRACGGQAAPQRPFHL